jgi:hypothetical protein
LLLTGRPNATDDPKHPVKSNAGLVWLASIVAAAMALVVLLTAWLPELPWRTAPLFFLAAFAGAIAVYWFFDLQVTRKRILRKARIAGERADSVRRDSQRLREDVKKAKGAAASRH